MPIDQKKTRILLNGVLVGMSLRGKIETYERVEAQERYKRIQEENARRKEHKNPKLPPSAYEEIEQRKRLQSVLGRCASQKKPDKKKCEKMVREFLEKEPNVVKESVKFKKIPEGDLVITLVDVEYYFILSSGERYKMTGSTEWHVRFGCPSCNPDGIYGFSRSMSALGYSVAEKTLAAGAYNAGTTLRDYLLGGMDRIGCKYVTYDEPKGIVKECKRITDSPDRLEAKKLLEKYIKEAIPNVYTANCLRAAISEGGAR